MSFSGQPTRRRKRSKSRSNKGRKSNPNRQKGRRTKNRVTKVRLVKGKVALRIKGYPGLTKLGASQLVRFVPLNKLKAAAKRALGTSRVKRPQHRRRRRRQQHSSN